MSAVRRLGPVMALTVLSGAVLAAPPARNPVAEAERLAQEALAQTQGAACLARAQKALALSEEFDPTVFVEAGRKGEVVEDTFVQARNDFRRHRARLYETVGECLLRTEEKRPAVRYLSRAVLLDATQPRRIRLARALLADGRPRDALDRLRPTLAVPAVDPAALSLLDQIADAANLPSAQAEIDRARLAALGKPQVVFLDQPLRLPATARLSTGGPLALGEGVVVFYLAATGCRTCSDDLETLKRVLDRSTRFVIVPQDPELDQAIRQVVSLYRYTWPILLGRDLAAALGVAPGSALVAGRSGAVAVEVKPPLGEVVPQVAAALSRSDVRESVPRSGSEGRPRDVRPETGAPPALLPEGLAPGEDTPAPGPFTLAVEAFRAGRALEALRFFDALAAKNDGWLLPPEARLNRALCLAAMGDAAGARKLLLRTGDSRFQEAVDRALERVDQPRRRPASPR
jgi:hypothetical protein